MISVNEATQMVLATCPALPTEKVALENAAGRVLAEDVRADRHFPPYDRVTMDGIAIRYSAWEAGRRTFRIAGTQLAGEPPAMLRQEDTAIEVMTGAVLPEGADTVVPYEDVNIEHGQATLITPLRPGQNIHMSGSDQRQGTVLLKKGTYVGPAATAVLATVGAAFPLVFMPPKVAIVATGDELVPVASQPLPHQIRSSNSQALAAALAPWHIKAGIFHLRDDRAQLELEVSKLLESYDALLLSGGVSKGKADYLPEALESAGVKKMFHRVAQKPGKPLWFGTKAAGKFVFAFPGNPVSTFMCFHRYFLPWLRKSLCLPPAEEFAKLGSDFKFQPSLTYFLQVNASPAESGEVWALPRAGGGSGDLANLLFANAFLELPANKTEFRKGEVFPLIRF